MWATFDFHAQKWVSLSEHIHTACQSSDHRHAPLPLPVTSFHFSQSLLLKRGISPPSVNRRSLLQAYVKHFYRTALSRHVTMACFNLPLRSYFTQGSWVTWLQTIISCFVLDGFLAHGVFIYISSWVVFNHIKYKRFFICCLALIEVCEKHATDFQMKESNSWCAVFGQTIILLQGEWPTFFFFLWTLNKCLWLPCFWTAGSVLSDPPMLFPKSVRAQMSEENSKSPSNREPTRPYLHTVEKTYCILGQMSTPLVCSFLIASIRSLLWLKTKTTTGSGDSCL